MPANLTPQYKKAEEAYRKATTIEEKISALEDMLALIPKHKGTDKLQADIKRKLAQCRQAQEKQSKKKGGRRDPFHVERSGGGQVTFLGTPNTGKTALVNALCGTEFKEGDYPFTTQGPAPGMTYFEDAAIQVVDLPPITQDMVPPGMVGALRQSDLVAIVIGLGSQDILEQVEICEGLLNQRGIIPLTKSVQEVANIELEIGFPKSCLI
ncbi:MAG: GTP-binding protein HSR1, partial [Planctomycetota bacterium]